MVWQHWSPLADGIIKDLLDDHQIDVIYNPVGNQLITTQALYIQLNILTSILLYLQAP